MDGSIPVREERRERQWEEEKEGTFELCVEHYGGGLDVCYVLAVAGEAGHDAMWTQFLLKVLPKMDTSRA